MIRIAITESSFYAELFCFVHTQIRSRDEQGNAQHFRLSKKQSQLFHVQQSVKKIQLILRNRAKDEKVDYKNLRRGKYQVKAMLNAILKGKSQVWNKIFNSSSLTALELGRRKGFSLNKHKRRESCCSEGEKIIFCISIYFMRWQREGFERDQQRDDMK